MDTDFPVAADVRRWTLRNRTNPPPHVGGYKQLALAKTTAMLSAMKIRKARVTDAAVIADFNSRLAWETEKLKLDSQTIQRGVRAVLRDAAKGIYFVTEHQGTVIGQLLITYEWSDWRNGNFWWIQSVYVAAAHRQDGVFRSLFQHVEKIAAARRDVCGLRLYVEKNNDRAQRAYARLGMTKTHYEMFETDLRQHPKLVHSKTRAKLRA